MRHEGKSVKVLVKGLSLLGASQEEKASLLPLAWVMSECDARSCCSRLASHLRKKQKMAEQRDGKNLGH